MAGGSRDLKSVVFSIETSCDETAMALLEARGDLKNPRFRIIKSAVFSQIGFHREFGGVVPNIEREHGLALPELFKPFKELPEFKKVELIAVTVGPGHGKRWIVNLLKLEQRNHKKFLRRPYQGPCASTSNPII